jgi:para-nitrobenzyl esterase
MRILRFKDDRLHQRRLWGNDMLSKAITALVMCLALSDAASADPIPVTGGLVDGAVQDGVVTYKSIPYAAPPVGELRWRPPAPVIPWRGVRHSKGFAAKCMQPWREVPGYPDEPKSEDCLYLSIWAPEHRSGKLPVLVYLHGGGFVNASGTAPIYWGDQIAKQGVIVVNPNFRLNVFGFLSHPELSAEATSKTSGNYGLLDQIAVLQWIKSNIAAFGGDPSRVTIYGQSAGGQAISLLMTSPLAKDLFIGGIGESNAQLAPTGSEDGMKTLAAAEADGMAFGKSLGATGLGDLRAMPAEQLLKAAPGRTGGYPNVDGWVLPEDPALVYAQGRQMKIPLLVGWNAGEGYRGVTPTTPEAFSASLEKFFGPRAERAKRLYPADVAHLEASQNAVARDSYYGWGVWNWARFQRKVTPKVFVYYFEHEAPQPWTSDYARMFGRAAHGFELNYVTGHLDQRADLVEWTPTDYALQKSVMGYWLNFVRTGDPNGSALPAWPRFDAKAERVLRISGEPKPGPLPSRDALELMDEQVAAERERLGLVPAAP